MNWLGSAGGRAARKHSPHASADPRGTRADRNVFGPPPVTHQGVPFVKSRAIKQVLLTAVALLGAASIVVPAVAQSQNGKSKRDKGDFVRGNANSKAKRVT